MSENELEWYKKRISELEKSESFRNEWTWIGVLLFIIMLLLFPQAFYYVKMLILLG